MAPDQPAIPAGPDYAPATSPTLPGAETGASLTPGGYAYEVVDDEAAPSIDDTASFPRPGRGVPIWALALAAIVPAAVVGALVWFLAGTGGSDGGRVNADTTNLLHAFTQGAEGTITLRYEGKFPPGYPDGIPGYDGAEVVASVAQIQNPGVSYIVVQDVGDPRDTVAADLKARLDADPWQIEVGQDSRDTTFYQYRNTEDADLTGLVIITASEDDSRTTIITSIQQASGAEDREPDPFEAAAARSAPPDFPGEIPVYEGALLIESAYQTESGAKSFAVTYITKDGADDILDALGDRLGEAELTVEDGDPSTSSLEDAQAIRFSDEGLQLSGEIIVGVFPLDDSYTQIDVQVRDER